MRVQPNRYSQHWHLFCLGTTWWTLYFILGLPSNYFQTTSVWLILIGGVIFPTVALTAFGWRRCQRESARQPAHVWACAARIAFYMTVPLFGYDYLYLALHQRRGWSFLISHWYLTVFYVIPWLLMPMVAWVVLRRTEVIANALKN